MRDNNRLHLLISLGMLALTLTGCNDNGLPLVPVSGTVTFDSGPCPDLGSVNFQPIEVFDGLPRRPGTATFGTDGVYTATSFADGEGLLPGKYRVMVSCDSGQPDFRSPTAFEDITNIGPGYKPKELVVEKGSDAITLDIDVPLKKGGKK